MNYFEAIRTAVRRIPRGKVASYGAVARAAGFPRTARMVARALRDASARGIPWQRVVGSGGRILLPAEAGLHQRLLLELEGVTFSAGRVRMDKHGFSFEAEKNARRSRRAGSRHAVSVTGS